MKTALLIIDVQNDYFPNGKMELHNSTEASIRLKDLIRFFRNKSTPVIHVQHISVRPGSTFFLPDTSGAEFHENARPLDGEKIIIKYYPNSFRNTDLYEHLKAHEISTLVIAGMMTHMCIDTTVRAAFDFGFECIVAGDCCATKSLKYSDTIVSAENVQYSFLAALNGIFSKVLKKDDIIEMMQ